eukprot:2231232-Prymnesium_polylepis.1
MAGCISRGVADKGSTRPFVAAPHRDRFVWWCVAQWVARAACARGAARGPCARLRRHALLPSTVRDQGINICK